MSVEVQPGQVKGPEFLLKWEESRDRGRLFRAGTLSIAAHVAAVIVLLTTPFGQIMIPRVVSQSLRPIPLVAPPKELTQTAPNKGKISKEFDIASLLPHPAVPAVPKTPPRIQTPLPPMPAPSRPAAPETPKPAIVPEPPHMETAHVQAPALPPMQGTTVAPPAPQIQAQERPKLAFESVDEQGETPTRRGLGEAKLKAPGGSMEDTIRGALRGGSGGITVGDEGESSPGSLGGMTLPSSPGRAGSSLELLSDPKGIDFRPYLARILILVRRNWRVVFPESARLGQRGKVVAQFAISRDGSVPRLVLATESGTKALDQAAVSAISMSVPFPELPPGYDSDRVRLQLTFLYNIK